jgi:hypothetical protein
MNVLRTSDVVVRIIVTVISMPGESRLIDVAGSL